MQVVTKSEIIRLHEKLQVMLELKEEYEKC